MYGLNKFVPREKGMFYIYGLLQTWGNLTWSRLEKSIGKEIDVKMMDDFSKESIAHEYKFFCDFFFDTKFSGKECQNKFQMFLYATWRMASKEMSCFDVDYNAEYLVPVLSEKKIKEAGIQGQRMERRLRYYFALKKYIENKPMHQAKNDVARD